MCCKSQWDWDLQHMVGELPQALFNSPYARPAGWPQPVVVHLMRRPGEWGKDEKEARVAETFHVLLRTCEARACEDVEEDDGIPRRAAELQQWEEEGEMWRLSHAAWVHAGMPVAGDLVVGPSGGSHIGERRHDGMLADEQPEVVDCAL
eukprot:gnl/TRDRNA2_/TRDRNA2_93148_c0_seq1.p1 gnl/TRDRNA2_/TRDRNA2_93148_c0~~gnl/TRDRNA2_/TRDRNA2_93148_c0_seq1.p1  ORF type:complete len:149 (+),score=30.21 gnl/TRDRNA2_/TRDRNA2_93148_c0_seq1:3-449(+)